MKLMTLQLINIALKNDYTIQQEIKDYIIGILKGEIEIEIPTR